MSLDFYTDLMTCQTHGYIVSEGQLRRLISPVPQPLCLEPEPRREAVGFYVDPRHTSLGLPVCRGQFTPIDFASAKSTSHSAINPEGDIVGPYVDQSGKMHGFLLSRGGQEREDEERTRNNGRHGPRALLHFRAT